MAWKKVGNNRWLLTVPGSGAVGQVEKLGEGNYLGSTDYSSDDFETLADAKSGTERRARLEIQKGYYEEY